MAAVKGGLGRGLQALFGDDVPLAARRASGDAGGPAAENVRSLPIGSILPNPKQPRQVFGEEALRELADSIRVKGVLQPILVRPSGEGHVSAYEIVAGERRWRASQLAGLTEIPALIRPLSDLESMAIALIENLQREDLNPIEEAQGFQRLIDEFGATQDELATQLGKSRSSVANTLRLLSLPAEAREDIAQGRLSSGHGRSLMTVAEEVRSPFRERMLSTGMSVRQAEADAAYWKAHGTFPELAAEFGQPRPESPAAGAPARKTRQPRITDEGLKGIKDRLDALVEARITVTGNLEKGVISFHYQCPEELEQLLDQMRLHEDGLGAGTDQL